MVQLAILGKEYGCRVAIETGPERPETLKAFLDGISQRVPGRWVGVNYDPANLRMVCDVDPVPGVALLREYIFHTHAKDGKCLHYVGGEKVYGFFAEGGIGDLRMEECFIETPLGQGDVNVPAWLAALDAIGYDGYLTIEREAGPDPEGDIGEAVRYLRSL